MANKSEIVNPMDVAMPTTSRSLKQSTDGRVAPMSAPHLAAGKRFSDGGGHVVCGACLDTGLRRKLNCEPGSLCGLLSRRSVPRRCDARSRIPSKPRPRRSPLLGASVKSNPTRLSSIVINTVFVSR